MTRTAMLVLMMAALAACGETADNNGNPHNSAESTKDNPFEPEPTTGAEQETSEEATEPTAAEQAVTTVRGDVDSATYTPATGSSEAQLTLTGLSLDETPITAVYTRRPDLDRPGYTAFLRQDDALDRHATVYADTAGEGAVTAVLAVTGGQFNRYFGGVHYERSGAYTPPSTLNADSGLVTYAGQYIGLLNIAGDGTTLITPAAGTDPSLIPVDAAEVTGRILINVDFADNTLNGGIYDRIFVDSTVVPGGRPLDNIALVEGVLNPEDGTFTGNVEREGAIGTDIGDFAGVIGGADGAGMAGGIFMSDFDEGLNNEEEYGIFVLDQCGTPDATDPACEGLN